MRVALLSIIQTNDSPGGGYRAFVDFAGRSIVQRQFELALTLGCERIICLAEHLYGPLLTMQHVCEAAGARFHVIAGARALAGLVRAGDDLLVLGDGLLPLAEEVQTWLGSGSSVLVFDAETGIPAGFERIDLNHAWAGALVMPGRLVEKLSELPADCDIIASLLRISLQARLSEKPLPDAVLADGHWALITSGEKAKNLEPAWIRQQSDAGAEHSPGSLLAAGLFSAAGPKLIRRRCAGMAIMFGSLLIAIIGVLLGIWYSVAGGLALAAIAFVTAQFGGILRRIERAGTAGPEASMSLLERAEPWLLDLCLVALLMPAIAEPGENALNGLFLPLTLITTFRLARFVLPAGLLRLADDRASLAFLLAAGAVLGVLSQVTAAIVLLMLGGALFHQETKQR